MQIPEMDTSAKKFDRGKRSVLRDPKRTFSQNLKKSKLVMCEWVNWLLHIISKWNKWQKKLGKDGSCVSGSIGFSTFEQNGASQPFYLGSILNDIQLFLEF